MNDAHLYAKANAMQRRDAEEVLREFIPLVRWTQGGGDRILDVGCGDGDVTVNVLRKHLPEDFGKLVGSDLSPEMIEYAAKLYKSPLVDFCVMDIAGELDPTQKLSYDHLFSFFCLHWTQDQRSAIRNIYDLLKQGGDCIVSFLAKHTIFDVYKQLAQNPRWKEYLKDYRNYVSPYQYSTDPKKEFFQLMQEAGFKQIHVELREKTYIYKEMQHFRDSVFAVNPFLEKIPFNLHNSYFDDYLDAVRSLNLMDGDNNNSENKISIRAPYSSLIAFGVK